VALVTIMAFFRQHLQGIAPYREIFTGRWKPAAMPNQFVFWTYQDSRRKAVDNLERIPPNATPNTLLGAVTAPGFTTFEERLLNFDSSRYPPGLPTDSAFFHDTLGLKLAWAAPQTYTTNIPSPHRDVSHYRYLTIRVAKKVTGPPTAGPGVALFINIEDSAGRTGLVAARSDEFDPIPHPYARSGGWCGSCTNQAQLKSVRIPLRFFTKNHSGVDLTDIARITIRTEGSGEIGLDDIEFGR
jgi:hypothetical protein